MVVGLTVTIPFYPITKHSWYYASLPPFCTFNLSYSFLKVNSLSEFNIMTTFNSKSAFLVSIPILSTLLLITAFISVLLKRDTFDKGYANSIFFPTEY